MSRKKDSGSEFGEENDMPVEAHEKTPGVYVRAENELPHELDMLWSSSRSYQREERSPVVTFVAGFLAGGILTAAVFILFVTKPEVKTGANEMLAPISEEASTPVPTPQKTPAVTATPAAKQPAPAAELKMPSNATTYTVVNGDNLGKIAGKVYGSSAPEYIEKIQRANNMKSPDSLQIDQKLVIPPKGY